MCVHGVKGGYQSRSERKHSSGKKKILSDHVRLGREGGGLGCFGGPNEIITNYTSAALW